MSYKSARLNAGKKIKDVVEHMDVSMVSIWQWETGRNNPSADKLPKLAEFYGCTVDELLRDNPSIKKEDGGLS